MKKEQQINQILRIKFSKYIFLFIAYVLILGGCSRKNNKYFYVIFDNVEGLKDDSEVRSRGLNVGSIESMGLFKGKVIVRIKMKTEIEIPIDSKVMIYPESIIGSKHIGLVIGKSSTCYKNNDTIIADINENDYFIEDLANDKLN